MPYYWTRDQETKLLDMYQSGIRDLNVLGKELGRKPRAIEAKLSRLGVVVEKSRAKTTTTSDIKLPKDLPSVEEVLRMLAGALSSSTKAGLDRIEVQRLQAVATLATTYKEILTEYIDYRAIEAKLVDLEKKYAELAAQKTKNNAAS